MSCALIRYLSVFIFLFGVYPAYGYDEHSDITFKRSFDERTEPSIRPVQYLQIPPARNLNERVDRLLEGILVDIPPEYDHYGYEMRRYMAHILNKDIFRSRERLNEELNNILRADIVLKHWRKHLEGELADIAGQIEANDAPTRIRTTFNYNEGAVIAFLTEMQSWLDYNKALLVFLREKNAAEYGMEDGQLYFIDEQEARAFERHFRMREQAHEIVTRKYMAFRIMVY